MGSQRSEQVWEETIMRFSLIPLATIVSPLLGQLKFNGGVSSSSSSNGNSPSSNRNTNRPSSGSSSGVTDVDEKFFLGGDTPSLTGNQALDGGIVGLGLGALGAAVLGPTIQGALNGGQQSQGFNSCGRRKRQANFGGSQASSGGQDIDGEKRFFLPTGQGCTCNTNGRRRRQAPGEDEPGTRFFGGLFGGQQHCGSCCYSSQPFNNNNNGFNGNFHNQNQGFNNQNQAFNNQNQNNRGCQCDYSLTFRDQNGRTHGACQRADNTGQTWCYSTGWNTNCGDLQTSNRYQNNPWSYRT